MDLANTRCKGFLFVDVSLEARSPICEIKPVPGAITTLGYPSPPCFLVVNSSTLNSPSARSSSGLGHRPFTAKIAGSSPVRATSKFTGPLFCPRLPNLIAMVFQAVSSFGLYADKLKRPSAQSGHGREHEPLDFGNCLFHAVAKLGATRVFSLEMTGSDHCHA